ncbi:phosphatidylserine decarboxylase [Planococcus sp. CP5-4]|uniref:phosphatidylserine decarboxylase n=1 Tax=unclassified Planococcus (in: firmicutes) TaxID=2662419 RepID=UPI001C250878|nr:MULTISPECIES: phosphatidylserine decarboxylase [unclassified Planococcus (in: firmicutes)]MBU9672845.1 phosphatidylserine decarboxylase [Planococcus sp. CP5-4_YE]MBV0908617.1 phosphatidylserine decarboxylase [Planococcus sp. CP5-4_UN]MBW6063386.1 phosphatidylserine decarboxylase [Planococcus sp. CP5-4]
MKKRLYQSMIELGNGKASSTVLKRFAQSAISRKFIPGFINAYNIELGDIDRPNEQYTSLHDFFTRRLKMDARPIADVGLVSPVDGRLEIHGAIQNDSQFKVKDIEYSLAELLGSEQMAARYANGQYAILYLSPADYHRIHSPVDGQVVKQYMLGEKSYPVNRLGLTYGKSPISGNRRLITELETPHGRVLVVKVGAMYVNSIELTAFGSEWIKGQEVAYFSFGSTVALFFEGGHLQFDTKINDGDRVKVGEPLAYMV